MTFNPGTQLDPGQVTDRRGMGGAAASPSAAAAIGIVLLLAYVLLGGDPSDLGPVLEPGAVTGPGSSALATDCKTGQDANERDDCRILGYVNSIQAYWTDAFAASGETYQPADTVLFSGATTSGCGARARRRGPFYCPPDQLVYLDLDFFQELRRGSGRRAARWPRATSSPTSTATTSRTCSACSQGGAATTGAESRAVRIELQADCFAGVWATTRRAPASSSRSPMPRSPMRSMPRRPSATTGSRRRRRARSTPTRGRTARPPSASSGSRPATRAATRPACDTFNGDI